MEVASRYQQMHDWFLTPHGHRLEIAISELLQSVPYQNFSQRFLQIGSCGNNIWTPQLSPSQKWMMSPSQMAHQDIEGDPYHLPFGPDSLDVIFAPYILNLGFEPWRLIYELNQTLTSMGLLIFIGMNPIGIWRWTRLWGRQNWYQFPGGCSFWRLKTILEYFGYQQIDAQYFYYIPPVQDERLLTYFDMVDRFSKLLPVYPPAFYFLVMQKQEFNIIKNPVLSRPFGC